MNFETTGSIIAILIGICALGISIWQGYETRKNYHLSVIPNISVQNYFVNSFEYVGIVLKNTGIGPAIISKFYVKIDGQTIVKKEEFSLELNKFIDIQKKEFKSKDIEHIKFLWGEINDSIIPVGSEVPLIWVENKNLIDEENEQFIEETIEKISFYIEYKSLYGEVYYFDEF